MQWMGKNIDLTKFLELHDVITTRLIMVLRAVLALSYGLNSVSPKFIVKALTTGVIIFGGGSS